MRDHPGPLGDDEALHDELFTAFEVGRRVRGEPETDDCTGMAPCVVTRLREFTYTFQRGDRFGHRVAPSYEQLDRERLLQGNLTLIALDALRLGGQEIERSMEVQQCLFVLGARSRLL